MLSRLRESDKQLVSARREGMEMELFIKNSAPDDNEYILKSTRALMLRKREDEFITHMRSQLLKGHAAVRKQTAEVVEAAVSDQRAGITRLETDRQHFVESLAETMNEVTRLRKIAPGFW